MNEAEKLLKKLNSNPAVEPDEWEKEAIRGFKEENADVEAELITHDELKMRVRKANGRISLRVPRELHMDLIEEAEENGVSLNQYIVYKLAKS